MGPVVSIANRVKGVNIEVRPIGRRSCVAPQDHQRETREWRLACVLKQKGAGTAAPRSLPLRKQSHLHPFEDGRNCRIAVLAHVELVNLAAEPLPLILQHAAGDAIQDAT